MRDINEIVMDAMKDYAKELEYQMLHNGLPLPTMREDVLFFMGLTDKGEM